MKTAEELPKLKQLTLTDAQMDFVAACVMHSTAATVGDLFKALHAGLVVDHLLQKIGTEGLEDIVDKLARLI